MNLLPEIEKHIKKFEENISEPNDDRRSRLLMLREYLQRQSRESKPSNLVFICTHNSRRSHFGQVWGKVLADYYEIPDVSTFSGGTEATAFNPNAIQALRALGFNVEATDQSDNPRYEVHYATDKNPIIAWSKVYSDEANPTSDFCAIMTCSEADEACPVVLGATKRISLPYEDPKKADGTPQQAAVYEERCKQIAQELVFALSAVGVG